MDSALLSGGRISHVDGAAPPPNKHRLARARNSIILAPLTTPPPARLFVVQGAACRGGRGCAGGSRQRRGRGHAQAARSVRVAAGVAGQGGGERAAGPRAAAGGAAARRGRGLSQRLMAGSQLGGATFSAVCHTAPFAVRTCALPQPCCCADAHTQVPKLPTDWPSTSLLQRYGAIAASPVEHAIKAAFHEDCSCRVLVAPQQCRGSRPVCVSTHDKAGRAPPPAALNRSVHQYQEVL